MNPVEPCPFSRLTSMTSGERKHCCKRCKKSFPSHQSFAGHMNLHNGKRKQKRQSRNTLGLPNMGDGTSGYVLRERRHGAWLLCDSDSGEDEYLAPVPKTECQLCFKVLASCDALSVHMRGHARHERKTVSKEASRESHSHGCCDHDVAVSTPVLLTYGIEEMDGGAAYPVQKHEMEELDHSGHGQTGDAGYQMTESPSSDVTLKFSSLSQVLKAATTHGCKLCGKVFTSSKGLASHKKFHKVRAHGKRAASPKSAVSQTGQQLLGVDSQLLYLNLPDLSDKNYSSSRSPKSEHNPWWAASGLPGRVLGVV
ncbi:hypothetical protein BS78_01G157100 [Paspalum vaginatum]|nr:hypothetical protein BS78_01G157100 [Paspalum vaginatum]